MALTKRTKHLLMGAENLRLVCACGERAEAVFDGAGTGWDRWLDGILFRLTIPEDKRTVSLHIQESDHEYLSRFDANQFRTLCLDAVIWATASCQTCYGDLELVWDGKEPIE